MIYPPSPGIRRVFDVDTNRKLGCTYVANIEIVSTVLFLDIDIVSTRFSFDIRYPTLNAIGKRVRPFSECVVGGARETPVGDPLAYLLAISFRTPRPPPLRLDVRNPSVPYTKRSCISTRLQRKNKQERTRRRCIYF